MPPPIPVSALLSLVVKYLYSPVKRQLVEFIYYIMMIGTDYHSLTLYQNDSVADAVHNIIHAAHKVDEDVRLLENADETIRTIGKHPPRRSHSFSSASSSSSVYVL